MYNIDCLCNIFFAIYYIIISEFDFFIIFLLSIGTFIFIYTNYISNYFKKKYILNNIFHVIFIQGFCSIALIYYYLYYYCG